MENQAKTNYASMIICHITEYRRKVILWFPYDALITKTLEHIGFNNNVKVPNESPS